MKKNLFFSVVATVLCTMSYGQNLWKKTAEESLSRQSKMDRASTPIDYKLFSLDFETLKSNLKNLPLDLTGKQSNVVLSFPNPEGYLDQYYIYDAPVMDPALAAKYPGINSYAGVGVVDPTKTIRFSVTLFGLHAMAFSENGTDYIDTYTTDLKNYMVYNKSSVVPSKPFECLTKANEFSLDNQDNINSNTVLRASDGKFRIFRLAMACTIEYAAFHVSKAGLNNGTLAQKKAAVLAAMNVTMTRVNGIYERDMAMRMSLVADNDKIIFIDSDNFTNNSSGALIDESQAQITSIIGNANFDIGHTVSTGGGGLAGPSPCVNGRKASGITGSGSPVGDSYDIDYVAHEMGHQFGANHTFNGNESNCGGNRNDGTAVEPGSGTTILSYAGICGSQDVQRNSDAHFHAISIAEMVSLISRSANCAATTANNNAAPVSKAGLDYTIPKGTPFVLRGSATDANNDALTYCWEQTDTQISTQPPVQTATGGPNYRSIPPLVSPNRYLPKLADVIAGNLAPKWEVTPTVARTMNFALTVRDNKTPNGGQTSRDNMVVTVNGTAGPFKVTSQNVANIRWLGNSSQTITWDVAGTTANGVNTANVKISLSTDGGVSFGTALIASTPNDGSQAVTIPNNITSTNCRIMVEAIDNLFYAVNTTKFAISPSTLGIENFELADFALFPNPNRGEFTVRFTSNTTNKIEIKIHDMRGRAIFEKTYSNSATFNQNIDLNKVDAGIYMVSIIDGNKRTARKILVE
jgi:Metallo-peptidase family M12B Reprolysin-like/Secretion system C-terminal sorting domain